MKDSYYKHATKAQCKLEVIEEAEAVSGGVNYWTYCDEYACGMRAFECTVRLE